MKENTKIKEFANYVQKTLGPESNLEHYLLFDSQQLKNLLRNLSTCNSECLRRAVTYFDFYSRNIECVRKKDERVWSNLMLIICCSIIEGTTGKKKEKSFKKIEGFFNKYISNEDEKYLVKNWRQRDVDKGKCKKFKNLNEVIKDIYRTYRCNFVHIMGMNYIDPFGIEIDWNFSKLKVKTHPTVNINRFIEMVLKGIFKKFGYKFKYSNKPLGGF